MDELDRLFSRLVRGVRDTRPEYLSRAFEVGEMLGFVPYASVRAEVGFETNDDYAHAISRLLSGERGYLFADELMQDDLRAELASPNPDLAAYKAYANARITLALEPTRKALEAMGPPAEPLATVLGVEEAPTQPPRAPVPPPEASRAAPRRSIAAPAPRPLDPSAVAPARPSRPGCRYCGQPLPDGREVHFCPSCGQNLRVRRCGACSAELEAGWKFCISCGRAAEA
jgi:predicted RNA-binding Zn-ribbon protein involved in translation (DUF1610 family)